MYISVEKRSVNRQPDHCKLYGSEHEGLVQDQQIQSIYLDLPDWTWINAYEEISPPFHFVHCYRGSHSGSFVDLENQNVNQIDACLSKCTNNDTFFLSDVKCYCGAEGFEKHVFQSELNVYGRQCIVDNLQTLTCGNDFYDNLCSYSVDKLTRHLPSSKKISSILWNNQTRGFSGMKRCIVIKTNNTRLIMRSTSCAKSHQFLCEDTRLLQQNKSFEITTGNSYSTIKPTTENVQAEHEDSTTVDLQYFKTVGSNKTDTQKEDNGLSLFKSNPNVTQTLRPGTIINKHPHLQSLEKLKAIPTTLFDDDNFENQSVVPLPPGGAYINFNKDPPNVELPTHSEENYNYNFALILGIPVGLLAPLSVGVCCMLCLKRRNRQLKGYGYSLHNSGVVLYDNELGEVEVSNGTLT